MTCYYQSQPLISVLFVKCCIIYSFAIGVTILECQQSTNSTQHYVSVSNLPTLTSLLKHCFQNLYHQAWSLIVGFNFTQPRLTCSTV